MTINKRYIAWAIVLIFGALVIAVLPKKTTAPKPEESKQEQPEKPQSNELTNPITIPGIADKITKPSTEAPVDYSKLDRATLLAKITEAGQKEDYSNFALALKEVYKRAWEKEADFENVERATYVFVDTNYFVAGKLDRALEITTTVYNQVPSGWRFFYLRVLVLEKFGRDAFNVGDLVTAEKRALDILTMGFRLEGTNLLADVYIKKIESDIEAKDKNKALSDYKFIKDFEVGEDRRTKLDSLYQQIQKM